MCHGALVNLDLMRMNPFPIYPDSWRGFEYVTDDRRYSADVASHVCA